ncbi:GNS1/SUR4 family domain-containing protein [Phthorimaea operculella]|nr:GNS1/SUR4 family domain-containing protein [Phthorimaea operculella]
MKVILTLNNSAFRVLIKREHTQGFTMGTLIKNITHYYRYVNDDLADPRTNVFPLVSSPLPILAIMYVYHRFVRSWGPALMKDREPFQIKKIIIAYNVIQIALSVYVTLQVS